MENIASIDNEKDQKKRDGQSVSDSVENLKKIYRTGKKLIQAARWLFSFLPGGPLTLGAIIIGALLALAFFSIVFGLMDPIPGGSIPTLPTDSSQPKQTIPGLTLTLTGPVEINNGEQLQYTVSVTYNPSVATTPLSDIVVYDILPDNTSFVEATGAYTYENGQISWPMSQNQNSFTFTLRPTAPDILITNTVYAGVASGASAGANPTANSCSGKYNLATSPIGANFGDPDCQFTKDALFRLLQSLDPSNANKWYFEIVPCESGYNPNAYNGSAVDPVGAWGLFQMGQGRNGQFDHGDVGWSSQTSNAVTYNRDLINSSFAYWGCASN